MGIRQCFGGLFNSTRTPAFRAFTRKSSNAVCESFRKEAVMKPANDRQQLIINRMLEDDWEGFLNTLKCARLATCSNDTLLRDIQERKGRWIFIENPGGGRSTSSGYRTERDYHFSSNPKPKLECIIIDCKRSLTTDPKNGGNALNPSLTCSSVATGLVSSMIIIPDDSISRTRNGKPDSLQVHLP